MLEITRRDTLRLGAAAVAIAAIPFAPEVVALQPPPAPTWIVGTDGEWNWRPVCAPTADEAKLEWIAEWCGQDECEDGGESNPDCECEFCYNWNSIDAQRVKKWDGRDLDSLTSADWIRAGMGALCQRCRYETSADEGAQIVHEFVVCDDCMTLEDWDWVDPERAAEWRAEGRTR